MTTGPLRVVMASTVGDVNSSHLWRYARSLADAGAEVITVCPGTIRAASMYVGISHRPLDAPRFHFWYDGGLWNALRAVAGRLRRSVRLWRAMRDLRPDVVMTVEPDAWAVSALLRSSARFRLIEDLQEVYEDRSRAFPPPMRPLVEWVVAAVLVRLARHTDVLIHVSKERAKIYAYLGVTGVICFPFPELRDEPDHARLLVGDPVFVHAGALRVNYGGRELLAAMEALLDDERPWRVTVLGGVADDMRDDSRIPILTGRGRLEILPSLSPIEVAAYLAKSHVGISLVLPLDRLHTYAQPRKLYEYLAAGLPVLAADVPTIAAVVAENRIGTCVDARSAEAVQAGISWLLDNRDHWPQMGAEAYAAARRDFNWTVVEPRLHAAVFGTA